MHNIQTFFGLLTCKIRNYTKILIGPVWKHLPEGMSQAKSMISGSLATTAEATYDRNWLSYPRVVECLAQWNCP